MYDTISTKLKDQSWTDTQDAEFLEVLREIEQIINYLSTKIYIMTDYLEQYYTAVHTLIMKMATEDTPTNDSQLSSPTQTSAARDPRVGGNRATRRAAKRK